MGISAYARSADGNTSISGLTLAENVTPVANLNDAIRQQMADTRMEVAAFGASTLTAAATVTLGAEGAAQYLDGVTTVTGFATATAGLLRTVHWATATPVAHSSTLSLPGSANITSAKGDVARFRALGGSLGWKCEGWSRQSGKAIITSVSASDLPNDGVTYARMQNVSAASRLLGRGSAAGSGDPEEISLGTALSMSGTTLNGPDTVIQTDVTSTATHTDGLGSIPSDDTIPTSSEGTQILSLAFTPKSDSSTLHIHGIAMLGASGEINGAVTLFKDSDTSALDVWVSRLGSSVVPAAVPFYYTEASGSTSSRTYKLRAGGVDSTAAELNGANGARIFGGIAKTIMIIEERL